MPREDAAPAWRDARPIFAALGDATRLRILARLCAAGPLSATRLAEGARVSRQAVAKHLRVLADAALVSDARAGRESLWSLEPESLAAARRFLDAVSREWDGRLDRLRRLVESPDPETAARGSSRAPRAPSEASAPRTPRR